MANKEQLIYRSKPLFGFDIGYGTIKVIQIDDTKKHVLGYGFTQFDINAIRDGEVYDYEAVAKAIKDLFDNRIIGSITTPSVAVSLPVSQTFSRVITLPKLDRKDLMEAVMLEAEQYIPVPVDQLYLDYNIIEARETEQDILLAASPRHIVDSYVNLFEIIGLEIAIFEPSILSVVRLVKHAERTDIPTLILDLGSNSTDLIIYYNNSVRVTGSIQFGGDSFTTAIASALAVTDKQAHIIKTKYGLDKSKKQVEIVKTLEPSITHLIAEAKKIIRYFEDRNDKDKKTVEQIIILGGGANLPGFSTYLTNALRIPTRLCSSWQNLSFGKLQPPHQIETTMYATASGLALINPSEVLTQ